MNIFVIILLTILMGFLIVLLGITTWLIIKIIKKSDTDA